MEGTGSHQFAAQSHPVVSLRCMALLTDSDYFMKVIFCYRKFDSHRDENSSKLISVIPPWLQFEEDEHLQ